MASEAGRPIVSQSPSRREPKCTLPPEKVFSIQIGTELFRLSGASIASDAPSYFSRFFEEQLRLHGDVSNVRTLYIDRDPTTFQEIAKHLQGYHILPKDGPQFVKFFADAQFYSLPRLISQLFESEIFVRIGGRNFQIPRDIFSGPGDTPNFFTLGFAAFFASPTEVFPGLDRQGLLRPPAITPPSVPSRSGEVFAQLLHLLRGYPLDIRSESHREELLRDCRYFHLRGLEQKLIPHHISFNPVRKRDEIIIRLEDVRRSGIDVEDIPLPPGPMQADVVSAGFVTYTRPFIDEKKYDLIIEIGDESTVLDMTSRRPTFLGATKTRITSLLQIIASKKPNQNRLAGMDGSQPPPEDRLWASLSMDTDMTVDGEREYFPDILRDNTPGLEHLSEEPQRKRKRVDEGSIDRPWVVRNGQWRLCLQPRAKGDGMDFIMVAVKLDVFTRQRTRNRMRTFLGS
ncbi:K+ channel tetramerization domain-containing protein [Aspergillus sclerotioniger CBS 115572]|uniref:K+ channel tetramerization domain-containing protein n=1 Tax=Aspergillus sclerotioniger CBS 115572 TaxID=1450535 RepID=A0A317XC43_9EURO|nr:K+ channel tetramerization domain-containing protein [Aspergillus sclerotioniger CBS 115572]PWY95262.1 K+ channel tetramerization domain-containing protein [Aspergillus sclerotioniger CBS 115572]